VKTDVERLDPTRVKLSVEVPFEELRPNLDSAYRVIAGQVRVPGFRPGKVPARVIDARVGRGTVLEQAINDALPRLYGRAVEDSGIDAIGQPDIDITEIDDGIQLLFTAEVDVRPEFELPSRDDLEVTVDAATVTDDDVDAQIRMLRERFAKQTVVGRAAGDDDFVTIDLLATRDGETLEGGQAVGQTYRVGAGTMVEGLDEAVRGLSAGESTTFTTTLMGSTADEPADVTVTVHAVKEQELPDLDDDFAQLASEFDTVAEMRADVRSRLERVKRIEQLATARDRVLDSYVARADLPVPARMLEHELAHRNEAVERELETYGLHMDSYLEAQGKSAEEFDAETTQSAMSAIKAQFVLDALATKEQLSVDEGELTAHMMSRAQRAGMPPDQYVSQVMQSGNIQGLVSEVVRSKALALLVREARIVDSAGTEVDVAALEEELGS
jgi:trigger factor